jgi:hypothetical protein
MAMSNEEAIALVNSTNETLVKVSNETDALLREIQRLNDALASAGGAGGTITAELEAAIKAVDTRAKSIDQLVADVPNPESARKK